jgi:hypothetical protein
MSRRNACGLVQTTVTSDASRSNAVSKRTLTRTFTYWTRSKSRGFASVERGRGGITAGLRSAGRRARSVAQSKGSWRPERQGRTDTRRGAETRRRPEHSRLCQMASRRLDTRRSSLDGTCDRIGRSGRKSIIPAAAVQKNARGSPSAGAATRSLSNVRAGGDPTDGGQETSPQAATDYKEALGRIFLMAYGN